MKDENLTIGVVSEGDIARTGPSDPEDFYYVDISSVDRDSKEITTPKLLPVEKAPSRAKQVLKTGDVLVSMTRPNLNAVALVPKHLDGAIGSTGFHVIRAKHADPRFIFLAVQSREFIDAMCQKVQGALYPAVRPNDISSFILPPFSLGHQRRIVSKVDELFTEIEAGTSSLKVARAKLSIYRQSLLKQAFEGKLTEAWRKANPDQLEAPAQLLARIQQERESRHQQQLTDWQQAVEQWEQNGKEGKKPAKPRKPIELEYLTKEEISELPNLAETWIWFHLDGVCKVLSGYAFKSKDFCETGIPVIKIANVSYGEFVIKTQQYLPESFLESSKDFVIYPDDLLIALTRPITNNKTKVCEYPKDSPLALLNQRVAALKDLSIHKEYLLFFANSKQFKESIRSKFSETLQPNLSPKDLSESPIPLCSLPEQQEIVRLLEAQFTVIEQNEREIDAALERSAALRQSILKRAFSGQLVPQDPTDEPASVLLERIQEERKVKSELGKVKKTAKKKTTRKRAKKP